MDDVVARLGPAARFAPGGNDEVVAVCYASNGSAGDVAIMFQARRADADSIVSLAHVAPRDALFGAARYCAPLPLPAERFATQSGVALGMNRTKLVSRFSGPPSEQSARAVGFYYYEPFETVTGPRARCQLLSGLHARLDTIGLRSFLVYRLHSGSGC
jgi:hypothetical protein